MGCHRREGRFPQADSWTVLRGGSRAPPVQLGGLAPDPSLDELRGRRLPVYGGDPVVLRNCFSGGLLSLGEELRPEGDKGPAGWRLSIVTSSYQLDDLGADTGGPLIERLHAHNVARPGITETFQLFPADVPLCPEWSYPSGEGSDRTYLLGTYLSDPHRHELGEEMEAMLFPDSPRGVADADGGPNLPLAKCPVDVQERVLLDEVIGAMMGHEGQFLRYRAAPHDDEDDDSEDDESYRPSDEPSFVLVGERILGGAIDPTLESGLLRLLPLCSAHVRVSRYVASCAVRYECGSVARSLAEGIGELLGEYLEFVSGTSDLLRPGGGELTMSALHVRSRRPMRTMAVLDAVASSVRNVKGGELLNVLSNLAAVHYSGDSDAHSLVSGLLARSAGPYDDMLRSWLTRGKVHDPYGEFMIEVTDRNFRENRVAMRQGMEWTDWCREREEHVLRSLQVSCFVPPFFCSILLLPDLIAFRNNNKTINKKEPE